MALRRRFAFIELRPRLGEDWVEYVGQLGYDPKLLEIYGQRVHALNEQISNDSALGRQYCVGHSYFTLLSSSTPPAWTPSSGGTRRRHRRPTLARGILVRPSRPRRRGLQEAPRRLNMQIPVRNLWLLQFFASDFFRTEGYGPVTAEDAPEELPNLVARMLATRSHNGSIVVCRRVPLRGP